MSSKPASQRVFLAFALLAALVLASLPVQARPVRRPATGSHPVAVPGDTALSSLWRLVLSLWPGATVKEGTSIDPNGSTNHGGTPTAPAGDLTDEGVTIDPNGSK
ncbi:MAG: hypothetical protein ACJ76N_30705 [Thermoanaerobaculia bacterium]